MNRSIGNHTYYMLNREQILAKKLEQRKTNPEECRLITAAWRKHNPARVKAISARERLVHGPVLRLRTKRWLANNPERAAYYSARQRCNNPNHISFKNYGGRGIKMKYKSFLHFLADVGPRPDGRYSIDRINNNWHYEEGNCRWATPNEQAFNRRRKGTL